MKYILTEKSLDKDLKNEDAGSKAILDINKIAKEIGYKELNVYRLNKNRSFWNKLKNQLVSFYSWLRIIRVINKDDIVLMQTPIRERMFGRNICQHYLYRHGVRIISILHDVESLRNMWELTSYDSQEFNVTINNSTYLIVHNKSMHKKLKELNIPSNKMIDLEIFDYLYNKQIFKKNDNSNAIVVAGNCSIKKSPYIYKLGNLKSNFNIYGPNFNKDKSKEINNINYKGSFDANVIPEKLDGQYGLVWDGNKLDECAGNTGKYLQYNNPHKASLYLVSGLPLIVWKKSAIAKFVKENNVGVSVDSLYELDDVLKNISNDDYRKMKENVNLVSEKIRNGFYMKRALSIAEKSRNEN